MAIVSPVQIHSDDKQTDVHRAGELQNKVAHSPLEECPAAAAEVRGRTAQRTAATHHCVW